MLEPLLVTARRGRRAGGIPTPEPVPPVPVPPPFEDDEPSNPEPGAPVQEPPDEGDVPTRLPGHPGRPVHVHRRHTARHEHPGA